MARQPFDEPITGVFVKLLIAHSYSVLDAVGGSEVQQQYLAEYVSEHGGEVVYYVIEGKRGRPSRESWRGVAYRRVFLREARGTGYLRLAWSFWKLLDCERPDMVYTRSFKYLFVLAAVCRWRRTPLVFHLAQGIDDNYLSFWKSVRRRSTKESLMYFSVKGIDWADRFLSNCAENGERLRPYVASPCGIVYNMHPIPSAVRVADYPPIVSWIANFKALKRPQLFIELARRCADLNARFIMAGRIPDSDWGKEIRQGIERTGNLSHLGEIPIDAVAELLLQSSIVTLTSCSEGFNNSLIQAWLSAVPTLTFLDKDEIVRKNHLGFHVASVDELEQKTRFLLEHEEERRWMGVRARQYAIENHSIERVGEKYLEVFSDVISDHKNH